jgi:hypothetical protein
LTPACSRTSLQGFVSITYDGLEVNKQILASLARNKAIPFGVVEPLHLAGFHD